MRGRKPKPTKLKLLQGNAGGRVLNDQEPQPPAEVPERPAHLDAEAVAEWDRITADLHAVGLLTRIDRAALAAYCQVWSRWVGAEQKLAETSVLVEGPAGTAIPNPYLAVATRALEQMRKYLVEFGMTPSSRSRTKAAPQAKTANPFSLLGGKK